MSDKDKLALARYKALDREAAEHVESVIAMRTRFTGEPPYVGWKGLGLALTEALDERDRLTAEVERLKRTLDAVTKQPLTREQVQRIHPSMLEMRWANYTDHGPKPWEGYTFMGPQNYGNDYNPEMACLLWVRLNRSAALTDTAPDGPED